MENTDGAPFHLQCPRFASGGRRQVNIVDLAATAALARVSLLPYPALYFDPNPRVSTPV